MYDQSKARIVAASKDITAALDKIAEVMEGKEAVLNNATRLAVLQEAHEAAKKRLGAAKYDLAQTQAYGHQDNYTEADLAELRTTIDILAKLVKSGEFTLKNYG